MIQHPAFQVGSEGGNLRHHAGNRTSQVALPLAGVVTIGLGLFFSGLEPSGAAVLHADSQTAYDYDSDGLSNHFEGVLNCSQYASDSDGDGFPDLEEFARGSNPADGQSHPQPKLLSMNVSASGETDGIRLQIATYYRDGEPTNKNLQLGIVVGGVPRILPNFFANPDVVVTRWNDPSSTGEVLLVNAPFPEKLVHAKGQVSVFTMLSVAPASQVVLASAVDLISVDGVVAILQDADTDRGVENGASLMTAGSGGGGTIYKPIPTGDGSVPSTWSPGEICYQATVEVGSQGASVTREIIGAGCISGEGSCPSGCSESVGDVFETFDPIRLIGL